MFCSRLIQISILLIIGFPTFSQEDKNKAKDEIYSGKQDQNWEVVQTQLTALKGKLDAQAAVVQNLISEKMNLKGEALQQKIEVIKKEHQVYEKLVFDYNNKNEEFLTRYPERGLKEKRIYKRVKIKSLDSFEDDLTLRGRMNKLHNKVLRQYPKSFTEKNKNQSKTASEATKSVSGDVTNSIKFNK
jgi:hypothetical protein